MVLVRKWLSGGSEDDGQNRASDHAVDIQRQLHGCSHTERLSERLELKEPNFPSRSIPPQCRRLLAIGTATD